MAVRHLGELKKKKKKSYGARAEVEIHESTYVVGVHFSQAPKAWTPANLRKVAARIRGPGSRRLPQPVARAADCALSAESRGSPAAGGPPTPGPHTPARPLQTPLPPRDVQSKPQGFAGDQREPCEEGKKKPAPPSRCAPSPSLPDRHWERRGPPWQPGRQGARPPPPPGQRSPGRGGVPRPRPPRPPRSRILGASCLPHLPARPSCAHSRPAPLESGDEKGNPDRRRSSP